MFHKAPLCNDLERSAFPETRPRSRSHDRVLLSFSFSSLGYIQFFSRQSPEKIVRDELISHPTHLWLYLINWDLFSACKLVDEEDWRRLKYLFGEDYKIFLRHFRSPNILANVLLLLTISRNLALSERGTRIIGMKQKKGKRHGVKHLVGEDEGIIAPQNSVTKETTSYIELSHSEYNALRKMARTQRMGRTSKNRTSVF